MSAQTPPTHPCFAVIPLEFSSPLRSFAHKLSGIPEQKLTEPIVRRWKQSVNPNRDVRESKGRLHRLDLTAAAPLLPRVSALSTCEGRAAWRNSVLLTAPRDTARPSPRLTAPRCQLPVSETTPTPTPSPWTSRTTAASTSCSTSCSSSSSCCSCSFWSSSCDRKSSGF